MSSNNGTQTRPEAPNPEHRTTTTPMAKRPYTIERGISGHRACTQRHSAASAKRRRSTGRTWTRADQVHSKVEEDAAHVSTSEFGKEFGALVSSRLQHLVGRAPLLDVSGEEQFYVRLHLDLFASKIGNKKGWLEKADIDLPRLLRDSLDQVASHIVREGRFGSSSSRKTETDTSCSNKCVVPSKSWHSVTNSKSFHRLLWNLRACLFECDQSVLGKIRQTTVESMLRFRPERPNVYQVDFHVHWNIHGFMLSQFDGQLTSVDSVVILTGSDQCAQATTCAEYVRTVWPDTGPFFLGLLNDHILQSSLSNSCHKSCSELGK